MYENIRNIVLILVNAGFNTLAKENASWAKKKTCIGWKINCENRMYTTQVKVTNAAPFLKIIFMSTAA